MRIRLESIGCRLNIGEMDELGRTLAARGHRIVGPGDDTDLIVFNSCAVTHVAARKSRKLIRQLRRRHPQAVLVATGCYTELATEPSAALGVDLVVANAAKDDLANRLQSEGLLRDSEPVPELDDARYPATPGSHTRAFVKVQDGCDNRCTFCIVTVARGDARSRPAREVVREVRRLAGLGYREVVLSGVHLGSWGQDLGGSRLGDLIARLLSETSIGRVRLSSLEPWDLEPSFFDLWQDPRLLPHLHLPLQSGCDQTLERMARRTTQKDFSALVAAARTRIQDVSITSDVIVGFPGEDDAEFEESLRYVRSLGLAGLHVFRYSAREGTAAASMVGQVPDPVIRERSERMHALANAASSKFREGLVGRTMDVLWESSESRDDGLRWSGLTGNYARVVTDTAAEVDLGNRVLRTRLVTHRAGTLIGTTGESLPATDSEWTIGMPTRIELAGPHFHGERT